MDSFLESDDDDSESEQSLTSNNDNNDNDDKQAITQNASVNFTLDDIDWNAVANDMGSNVEIIESTSKQTPPLLLNKLRPVCNKNLLNKKLKELQSKTSNLEWFEKLTISTSEIKQNVNKNVKHSSLKNNDNLREIYFYQNTLCSVNIALDRIDDKLIERPNDYYASMIKTDDHMKKIKNRILWEKKKIGIIENRKKNKRLKKYNKELMSKKIKDNYARIKDWNENLNQSQNDNKSLENIIKDARIQYLNKEKSLRKKKPNMKRVLKNLKYGSGYNTKGLKGKNKNRNTYNSTNNFQRDWRLSKMKDNYRGGGGGGARRGGGARGGARGGGKFAGRGTKRFNSNKMRQKNKGNFNQYNKNIKRQRGILGKKTKRRPIKRPGKNTRRKMNRNR